GEDYQGGWSCQRWRSNCFCGRPDDYRFDFFQKESMSEPLCQVMCRVGDLDRSINFYEKGGQLHENLVHYQVINTKITACLDPDGWKMVFVDNEDFAKELKNGFQERSMPVAAPAVKVMMSPDVRTLTAESTTARI
ncbi:Lactoylglutathione lyase, partial [Nymphaea thermarum]